MTSPTSNFTERNKGRPYTCPVSRRGFLSRLLLLPAAVSAGVSAVVTPPKITPFWLQTARHSYCYDDAYIKAFQQEWLNAFFFPGQATGRRGAVDRNQIPIHPRDEGRDRVGNNNHRIPVGRPPAAPPLVKVRTHGISTNPCRQLQASAQRVTPAFLVPR